MLAIILDILLPQYSSTKINLSFITPSRMSQFQTSQQSRLGNRVATSSKIIPSVKTLLFSTISSSLTSSSPHLRAIMSSGEGQTSCYCFNFWQVAVSMSQLGSILKLPWSQYICSSLTSLYVMLFYCRKARVQVTSSIIFSISSTINSLFVFKRASRSCFIVVYTFYKNKISVSVYISTEFLKGVALSLRRPSH